VRRLRRGRLTCLRRRAARALPHAPRPLQGAEVVYVHGRAAPQLHGQDPEIRAEGARVTEVVTNVEGRPLSQRGLDTRRRLLHAAEAVFGELGFPEASVVKVADAAGVATGTFYLYFDSKRSI